MRDALREQALARAIGANPMSVRVTDTPDGEMVIVTLSRDNLDRLIDYDVTPHHEPREELEARAWAAD